MTAGACVRLVGMSGASKMYDGAEGVATLWDRALGRWHVKLWVEKAAPARPIENEGGGGGSRASVVEQGTLILAVRPSNLVVVSPPASVGCRVRLVQLTSPGEREHNGTEGVVSRWDAKRQWWVVERSDKKMKLAVRPTNLIVLGSSTPTRPKTGAEAVGRLGGEGRGGGAYDDGATNDGATNGGATNDGAPAGKKRRVARPMSPNSLSTIPPGYHHTSSFLGLLGQGTFAATCLAAKAETDKRLAFERLREGGPSGAGAIAPPRSSHDHYPARIATNGERRRETGNAARKRKRKPDCAQRSAHAHATQPPQSGVRGPVSRDEGGAGDGGSRRRG